MGEQELKAALRREMDSRVRQLWGRAEEEVATRRDQVEAEIERLREQSDARLQAAIKAERNACLLAAQQQGAADRLRAETVIGERLRRLAGRMLPELCGNERARLWRCLLHELPDAAWQLVRVHPDDAALARQELPSVRVEEDEMLGGGLVVELEAGRVRIDNSLQGRMDRCWPDLLSRLMAELRTRVDDNEAVESDDTA